MAKLPTNFQDDILAQSMDGKRRYILTENDDGTTTIEDASTYDQIGSNFGAGHINATNQAVNDLMDAVGMKITVTSKLLAGDTTLNFNNAAIKTTSYIDVYSDVFGVSPTNMTVINGTVSMTFDAQSQDVNIAIRIS